MSIERSVDQAQNHYSTGLQEEMRTRYSKAKVEAENYGFCPDEWWLDIGPSLGYGLAELIMNPPIPNVLAVDKNYNYLDTTLSSSPEVRGAVMDGCQLGVADETIGVVSLLEVIEHLPEERQVALLSEIRRVLKPDGLLILSTPNRKAHGKRTIDPDHKRELDENELSNLLDGQFELQMLMGQGFKNDYLITTLWENARDNPLFYWVYHHVLPNKMRQTIRDKTLESFHVSHIREAQDGEVIKTFFGVYKKTMI